MSFNPSQLQEFWLLLPLVVPVLWGGCCFLVSCMGWRWFSRKYSVRVRPSGMVHRVPTVKFEFVGTYRNSVRVIFVPEGIYFSAPWLYRLFHAPFLLPWRSVGRIRKKAGFRQRGRGLIVEVEDEEGPIRLWLSKEMEEEFFKHYRPNTPAPTARRAFPLGRAHAKGRGQAQANCEEANEGEQANAGAGSAANVHTRADVNANANAMASPFTIVGMGLPVPGSSGTAAPVQPQELMGAPVDAQTPVAVAAAIPSPVAAHVPVATAAPTAIRSVFVPISESGPVPVSTPAPVPTLATFTAAMAGATMMADPRS
jgi:hypothetical protein